MDRLRCLAGDRGRPTEVPYHSATHSIVTNSMAGVLWVALRHSFLGRKLSSGYIKSFSRILATHEVSLLVGKRVMGWADLPYFPDLPH